MDKMRKVKYFFLNVEIEAYYKHVLNTGLIESVPRTFLRP